MEKVVKHPQKNHILALASSVVSCIIRADIDSQNNDGRQCKIMVLAPSAGRPQAGFALAPGFLALRHLSGRFPARTGPSGNPHCNAGNFLFGAESGLFLQIVKYDCNKPDRLSVFKYAWGTDAPSGRAFGRPRRHSSYNRPALPRYCGAGRKSKREDSWKSTVLKNHSPFWSRS